MRIIMILYLEQITYDINRVSNNFQILRDFQLSIMKVVHIVRLDLNIYSLIDVYANC
jgi:hypothetical protein